MRLRGAISSAETGRIEAACGRLGGGGGYGAVAGGGVVCAVGGGGGGGGGGVLVVAAFEAVEEGGGANFGAFDWKKDRMEDWPCAVVGRDMMAVMKR